MGRGDECQGSVTEGSEKSSSKRLGWGVGHVAVGTDEDTRNVRYRSGTAQAGGVGRARVRRGRPRLMRADSRRSQPSGGHRIAAARRGLATSRDGRNALRGEGLGFDNISSRHTPVSLSLARESGVITGSGVEGRDRRKERSPV